MTYIVTPIRNGPGPLFRLQVLLISALTLLSCPQPVQSISQERTASVANSTSNGTFVWVIEDTYQGKTFFEYVFCIYKPPSKTHASDLLVHSTSSRRKIQPSEHLVFGLNLGHIGTYVRLDSQWEGQVRSNSRHKNGTGTDLLRSYTERQWAFDHGLAYVVKKSRCSTS